MVVMNGYSNKTIRQQDAIGLIIIFLLILIVYNTIVSANVMAADKSPKI
jgi:hypothetical protein